MHHDGSTERICPVCRAVFTASYRSDPKRFCSPQCGIKGRRSYRHTREQSIAAFWAKVTKTDGCWTRSGASNGQGYSIATLDGQRIYAHRLSYILHFGGIPDGLDVLHKCDNPPCVRPDHLFAGTHRDNMTDMVAKNRHDGSGIRIALAALAADRSVMARGEGHGQSKVTENMVRDIRERARRGESQRSIADAMPITQVTVGRIIRREIWAHVE
jgi:hypothetical protein